MSSWSEIRARSGDPLSDSIADLVSRANMSEAVTDQITISDKLSHVKILRSKIGITDENFFSAYSRPRNPDQKYYMPLEPDGDKVRLDIKFDHGGETLTDYAYMGNMAELGYETEQPTLLKNPEDDGITPGELCSILDGIQHFYRVPRTDNNSLKKMVETGQDGFSLTIRVWYITVVNQGLSGGAAAATLFYFIENDQVEYAIKGFVDDEAYLHVYLKMGNEYYYAKSSQPQFTTTDLSDYQTPDFGPSDFDTGLTQVPIPQVIPFIDFAITFDFTTKELLLYKNGQPVGTEIYHEPTLTDIATIPNLSLWLPINEGIGTTLSDISINGLTATIILPARCEWQPDRTLLLKGTGDGANIEIPNHSAFNTFTEMTLCFWYKPITNNASTNRLFIIGYDNSAHMKVHRSGGANDLRFSIALAANGTGSQQVEYNNAFPAFGEWYFVTCKWKSGEELKISINAGTDVLDNVITTGTFTELTRAFEMVDWREDNGIITNVMFFKRQLTSLEITNIYDTLSPMVNATTEVKTSFPVPFADPDPPPPPGTATQEPFVNVMNQTIESAQVKINKVTTSNLVEIYNVAGGAPEANPFANKYTVPEGTGSNTTNPYATPPFYSMAGASSTGNMVYGDNEIAYGQYIELSGSALNGKKLTRLTLELNNLGSPQGGTVYLGIIKANGQTIKFGAGILVSALQSSWTSYQRTGNQDIATQYTLAVGDGVGVIWEGGTGGQVNIRRTGSNVHQASEDAGNNSCQAQYVSGQGWSNINKQWAMAAIMETGGETIIATPWVTMDKANQLIIGEQFSSTSIMYNNAPTKLEFKVYKKAGTTGTLFLQIITSAGAVKTNGTLKQWDIATEITATSPPAAGVYNITWENILNTVTIGSGERICLVTPASGTGTMNTGGELYVLSNNGNNAGANNYNSTSSYIVKRTSGGSWSTFNNALDISGNIWIGGNDFTGYIHLNDTRKRTGIKADTATSSFVTPEPGKIVTQVAITAKKFGSPADAAIYCRIRSPTGILRATIGQRDASEVLGADTSLTFTNVDNTYPMDTDDQISIEYDAGTATNYIMIRVSKNAFETTNTILFETLATDLNTSLPVTDRDLAAIVSTGGQIDTAARPRRGIKIKANSSLIGDPVTESRIKIKRTGSFGAGEEMSVKIIRGSDKVTVATLDTKELNTISDTAFVEYIFQNTGNSYPLDAEDFIAIENNYGNSTTSFIEIKTSTTNIFDGVNTIMFEWNGTTYTEVSTPDLTAQLYIGGFMIFPDPNIPNDPTPHHYYHGWFFGASTTPDSDGLINPIYLKPEEYTYCHCVLKQLRLFSMILTPTQITNYFNNRFTTSNISKGGIEIVGNDISGYDE